jgi:hypothetical protein
MANDFNENITIDMREIEARAHQLRAEAARDLVLGFGALLTRLFSFVSFKTAAKTA